jgi:hypothetical protein
MLANDPQAEQAVAAATGTTNGGGPPRRSSRVERPRGLRVLFLINFVASIPAVILYAPCFRSSSGKTKASPWAMSPVGSLNRPSSSSDSSASSRS